MYFLSNVRTFCIKSFTDGVSFGTDCENSRTQGCPSLPHMQFFFIVQKPLTPCLLSFWTFGIFLTDWEILCTALGLDSMRHTP